MRVFGLAGWSGSGKTTLIARIIPELVRSGVTVSTVKHAHHGFDMDQPGKDSWKHRAAGATEVMVASGTRWALLHELRGTPEPELEALATRLAPVDLLIVEGFKRHRHPKIEIIRPSLDKPRLYREDEAILAVALAEPLATTEATTLALPAFDLEDIAGIAAFILANAAVLVETAP